MSSADLSPSKPVESGLDGDAGGGVATPRIQALTGIRILAAFAVYASHVGPPAGAPRFVQAFFESGYNGVTLFFVLSGFVLALNYFDGFRRPHAGRTYNYFVARFARVYPLYLLVLLYLVLRWESFGLDAAGWWRHALAIQAWYPDLSISFGFNPPAWSIGVEFFLYACFPLLVPLIARLRGPRALLLAGAGVVVAMVALTGWFDLTGRGALPWENPASAHRWLYVAPLPRLGDFALGILAARLYLAVRGSASVARLGPLLVLGAALLTVALMCWPPFVFNPWSWDLAYALPATAFIFGLAIAPLSLLARAFSLPSMILLGEASYAFYLVHFPALSLLGGGRWGIDASPTTAVFEVLTLGAIVALAIGLHVCFERPVRLRIRKVFSLGRRSPAPLSEPAGAKAP